MAATIPTDAERMARIKDEPVDSRLTAYTRIPYALINAEVKDDAKNLLDEMTYIASLYKIYRKGARFTVEGTNGDYTPAVLRYRMASALVNKQARFLFADAPDLKVEAKGDVGKVSEDSKKSLTILNDLVKTVLDANKFEEQLIKAAKDCFIGKRVAGLVNFNEEDGVTITFLPSTQFVYETRAGNPNVITKFVAFIPLNESLTHKRRIFRKKYSLIDDVVWLEETIHDGAGAKIEDVTEPTALEIKMIPACIFINDGLTGDMRGESEIEQLADYEQWYSRLSNADIDAQRKSMNPIRYTVDMDNRSTKGLSSSAGSFWDLQSDQNLEKTDPKIGMLESSMTYSESLGTSLDRLKSTAYEQVDMPNVSLESMSGVVTSGKSLKAIYWPLIVRCKEKMKMWGPQLRRLVTIIIEGAMLYPDTIVAYTDDVLQPVAYEIVVEVNHPLPEDELEERNQDLAEVAANAMSRKAYMKKWRLLTDDEAQSELEQMAMEREMLEDASFGGMTM